MQVYMYIHWNIMTQTQRRTTASVYLNLFRRLSQRIDYVYLKCTYLLSQGGLVSSVADKESLSIRHLGEMFQTTFVHDHQNILTHSSQVIKYYKFLNTQ